jgi:[ribosomal protein S18]-alanine N-acetyltransferase
MLEKANIRKFEPSDRENLLEIFQLNTPQFFSPSEENDLKEYLNNHLEDYYVIVLEKKLVGSGGINYAENNTIGKISWDLIHPDYQKKGLGNLLLNYRIKLLKENPEIRLISVRTSQFVYKFYEKAGFELHEVVKNYWAEGFDLYHMKYKEWLFKNPYL